MASYSFLDVQATMVGPTGNFQLGSGAGNAEEGISISMIDDKGSLTVGADGSAMHSLHAGKAGTVTVRLLKTSPTNALLAAAYAAQTASSALYGQNTILIRNPVSGDTISARQCGFRKLPDIGYAKVAGTQEWVFNAGQVDMLLGSGNPEAQQPA